jgi:hypothetical protein
MRSTFVILFDEWKGEFWTAAVEPACNCQVSMDDMTSLNAECRKRFFRQPQGIFSFTSYLIEEDQKSVRKANNEFICLVVFCVAEKFKLNCV